MYLYTVTEALVVTGFEKVKTDLLRIFYYEVGIFHLSAFPPT